MTDETKDQFCRHAIAVQGAISKGWSFGLSYGDEASGFKPKLIAYKGNIVVELDDPSDLSALTTLDNGEGGQDV